MARAALARRGAVLCLGCLVGTALAGCTGGDTEPAPSELLAYEARIWGELDSPSGDPRQREAEEGIAVCMAEAGFEYTPEVAPDQHQYSGQIVPTREYAAEFGYGETIAPAPGVTPSRWAFQIGDIPGQAENISYRAGLSAQAEEEYWTAMNGDVEPEDADAAAPEDFGCRGRVFAEVYADTMVPEAFREAETAIRQSWRDVEAAPRVTVAVDRWIDCMADAGYPGLTDRYGGQGLVNDAANAFPAPGDMPFEEIAEVYATELAEIQDYERTVALTDVACLEDTDFYATWDQVESEIHSRVVETYRDDLEAWATWAEEQREARP